MSPASLQDTVAPELSIHFRRAAQVRSRFYAISAQRRLTDPAVKALQEAAPSAPFH